MRLEDLEEDTQEIINRLIHKKEVDVYDPFIERNYTAKLTELSSSYTVGSQQKSYNLLVQELDRSPSFDAVELNGIRFNVISYEESLISNTVSRQGVLKLTKKEFESFRKLLPEKTIAVRRIGVDKKPFKMRFGSQMFWSEHNDGNSQYIKHIFRLFDKKLEPGTLDIASGVIQDNATEMLIALNTKFEGLLEVLKTSESLSDDTKTKLENVSGNVDANNEQLNELYSCLEKVVDADRHF